MFMLKMRFVSTFSIKIVQLGEIVQERGSTNIFFSLFTVQISTCFGQNMASVMDFRIALFSFSIIIFLHSLLHLFLLSFQYGHRAVDFSETFGRKVCLYGGMQAHTITVVQISVSLRIRIGINYVVVLWRSHVYFDPIKVYMKKVMLATIRIRTDQNEHSPLH